MSLFKRGFDAVKEEEKRREEYQKIKLVYTDYMLKKEMPL